MGKRSALLMLSMLLLLTLGCEEKDPIMNTENEAFDRDGPKVLRLASTDDIALLDQSKCHDATSLEVLGNTLEGLFILTGGNQLEKGVCESYTLSVDGMTYTFKLREDSVWSNGEPVTAHDFVYSWRRFINPQTRSTLTYYFKMAKIKNSIAIFNKDKTVKELGVYAQDKYTLVVELEEPVPYLPSLLACSIFSPLNKKFVEENGDLYGTSIANVLFNGPYVLHKWEPSQQFIYKKNKDYWNKEKINIEEVSVTIVKDINMALEIYNLRIIDYTDISPNYLFQRYNLDELAYEFRLPLEDSIKIYEPEIRYLQLNQNNQEMKNANFRRAIALSIDKSYISDKILENGCIPVDYLVPIDFIKGPDGKDFRETTESYNQYNPEVAKMYWEKAKEELGINTATIVFTGHDMLTVTEIISYIEKQLESNLEGLSVEQKYYPFSSKLQPWDGTEDIIFSGWWRDYLDPMNFLEIWATNNEYNFTGYNNDEFNSIIESVSTGNLTNNPEKRWTELQRAEEILLDRDVVLVPLYQRVKMALLNKRVKNWQVNSFDPYRYWGTMDIE